MMEPGRCEVCGADERVEPDYYWEYHDGCNCWEHLDPASPRYNLYGHDEALVTGA